MPMFIPTPQVILKIKNPSLEDIVLEQAERGTVLNGLVELNATEFDLLDDIMAGVANV